MELPTYPRIRCSKDDGNTAVVNYLRLQAATTSGKPVLLRIDYPSGHNMTSETNFSETTADAWSFLLWQLGVPEFQPKKQ